MRIFVEFDEGVYRLMADDDRMGAMPAGPRLMKQSPYPYIAFQHDTLEDAEIAAAALRRYLDGLPARKQTKKELREAGA